MLSYFADRPGSNYDIDKIIRGGSPSKLNICAGAHIWMERAKVVETHTYDPNVSLNSKYSSENIDMLNEQRYSHFKTE